MSAAEISISSQRDAANTLIVIFSAAIVPVMCQHIIFKGYILHFIALFLSCIPLIMLVKASGSFTSSFSNLSEKF